jgi:hypothetical protein
MIREMRAAKTPRMREFRIAYVNFQKISCPSEFVPRGYPKEGKRFLGTTLLTVGPWGEKKERIANEITIKTTNNPLENLLSCLIRSFTITSMSL